MNGKQTVLNFLKSGRSLTTYDGFNMLGLTCAKDYVSQLRRDGYPITDAWITNPESKKRYKVYALRDTVEK